MSKKALRSEVLDAVNRVVAKHGLSGTTIDAVAREAGASKGGVLYHFPSKKELLLGMLERYEEDFFERREKVIAQLPESPHRSFRASILLFLDDQAATEDLVPNMATILDDPDLRNRVGDFKRRAYKDALVTPKLQGLAALIMYILDGMWMDNRFQPPVVEKAARANAVRRLLKLLDAFEADTL